MSNTPRDLLRKGDKGDKGDNKLISDRNMMAGDEDVDREVFNFSSAPQNAKSALEGNQGLKERHEQFQRELKQRGVR